jgi:hypothetical protein
MEAVEDYFWLTDAQFAKLESHLHPTRKANRALTTAA